MGISRRTSTTAAPAADAYSPPPEEDTADAGLTPESETETTTRSSSVVKAGWGAAKKKIAETSKTYADDWTPPMGDTLVKFMQDEPFASVGQHWIDEIRDGKRSFNCPEDDCPLCDVGHDPRALVYFNVVPLVVGDKAQEEPVVHALKAGPLLTEKIEKESEGKGGPLSRHYWVIKRWETQKGKRKSVDYSLSVAKGRDIAEDWELDPEAVTDAIQGLELFDTSIIPVADKATLTEVVKDHLSND